MKIFRSRKKKEIFYPNLKKENQELREKLLEVETKLYLNETPITISSGLTQKKGFLVDPYSYRITYDDDGFEKRDRR